MVNVEEDRTPSEQVGVDAYTKDLAEFGFLDMVSILLLESFAVRYYRTYCICLFPVPLQFQPISISALRFSPQSSQFQDLVVKR